ncbi:hypothetical protein [Clostridioides difficile]|nr:hypothetical protein [Clostridioides difficile]
MKKIRKLATKLLIAMMVLTSCMSVTVYGMTAKVLLQRHRKVM